MMLPGQWDRGTQAHTITITTIGDWIAGNGLYIHRIVWSGEREREREILMLVLMMMRRIISLSLCDCQL